MFDTDKKAKSAKAASAGSSKPFKSARPYSAPYAPKGANRAGQGGPDAEARKAIKLRSAIPGLITVVDDVKILRTREGKLSARSVAGRPVKLINRYPDIQVLDAPGKPRHLSNADMSALLKRMRATTSR